MEQNTCNKCGRPMQYATEPKCNYCDACMNEYCGCKLGRIKEMDPTCDSTAVIPSITVESVEGITNLANCLVHVNDINTTFYVDDKHRIMITWAGPVNIPGYDMKNNPNGYRDQIVTDVENETAVIYDKHGKGYLFGITPDNLQTAINNKLDEMASDGSLENIVATYIADVAHVFDTVADMKASTELVNGSYARTLGFHTINDGGGALYKVSDTGTANEMDIIAVGATLYAELILPSVVTPEIYGAYCDGVNDDSGFIQASINSGRPVLLSKNYLTTSSVYIGNQEPSISGGYKKNLVIDGSKSTVTYTGGNSAFVIAGVQGGTLRFGTINASNGSCIEMWSTNGNVRIVYLDIYFNELRPSEKAIYVHANTGSSGTGFINQIKINGGTIYSGDYGIYVTSTNETNGDASGYTFNGVAFEGCDVCFYGGSTNGKLRGFTFNDIRYVENDSAPLFVFDGNIDNFYMQSWGRLYPSRIDMTNATVTQFRIDAPIADNSTSTTRGDGLYIDSGHIDWLSNRVSSKTLTKATNASGTIVLYNQNNQLYLSFVGVYGTTATQTLVTAANSPCIPIRRVYGVLTSSDGTICGRVSIESDGEIKMNTSSGNIGTPLYGSLLFASYDKKYF